jgi:multidrug efflux pump
VLADVVPGTLPAAVVDRLAPAIADIGANLPRGCAVEVGGIAEESAKSRASIFAVVPLMLVALTTLLERPQPDWK